jgi:SAM-dependent methyltransferase
MPIYRLLIHPSANRVYARDAPVLAAAEVRTVTDLLLPGRVERIDTVPVGRAGAVRLTTGAPLDADDQRMLATCASALALFEERGDGGDLLAPLAVEPLAVLPDDLLTTLKYGGKTNEQFTALMVNLALAAGRRGFRAALASEPVRLLDPLCGRGTTLNQALVYGLDAVGIETRDKETEAYVGFIRQWLRDNHVKHRSESLTLRRGPGRDRTARHVTVTIAAAPTDDRRVSRGLPRAQVLEIIADDTVNAGDHVKGSTVDLVVGDLPYGVQHTASSTEWGASRNPAGLLRDALPVWRRLLRGGGSLCLAFNTNVIPRAEVDDALVTHGFDLVEAVTDGRFAHRVDRSIRRDVALAVKPG